MTTTTTTTPTATTANIAHTSPIATALTPMATAQATVHIHTPTTPVHDFSNYLHGNWIRGAENGIVFSIN